MGPMVDFQGLLKLEHFDFAMRNYVFEAFQGIQNSQG